MAKKGKSDVKPGTSVHRAHSKKTRAELEEFKNEYSIDDHVITVIQLEER